MIVYKRIHFCKIIILLILGFSSYGQDYVSAIDIQVDSNQLNKIILSKCLDLNRSSKTVYLKFKINGNGELNELVISDLSKIKDSLECIRHLYGMKLVNLSDRLRTLINQRENKTYEMAYLLSDEHISKVFNQYQRISSDDYSRLKYLIENPEIALKKENNYNVFQLESNRYSDKTRSLLRILESQVNKVGAKCSSELDQIECAISNLRHINYQYEIDSDEILSDETLQLLHFVIVD